VNRLQAFFSERSSTFARLPGLRHLKSKGVISTERLAPMMQ